MNQWGHRTNGEPMGSYMVRPVLQVLFDRNIKKYCIHISGFCKKMSNTSSPDGIRAFLTLSDSRPQWALDPSRFLGMLVLPFMPSLKILSSQLVANAFLAIMFVLLSFFSLSCLVSFLSDVGVSRRNADACVESSLTGPHPTLPYWQGPVVFGPCLPARVG